MTRTALYLLMLMALQGPVYAGPVPGDRVAAFALPAYGGGLFRWEPGKATVFSFCAFWCDTWKVQNERLAAARRAAQGLPVQFLTISVDGRWAERGPSRAEGTVLLDPGGAFSSSLGIHTVPYTVVIDPGGWVRYAAQGIVARGILQNILREAATGAEAPSTGTVYLTFDDFPAGAADEELLDLLRAQGVHATFFCIGQHVAAHPKIARRAAEEGHVLQLHSWNHDARAPDLDRCIRALRTASGARPSLYRPPGSAKLMRLDGSELRMPVVNPYDYTRPGDREITRRVLLAVKPGSVILLHAGVSETRAALPRIVAALRERGLTLGVLK